jgi:ClpP class serine protease
MLLLDTPGGAVTGLSEFSDMLYSVTTKPIVAYIAGLGASAGYWIASGARKIIASETAVIGSVGVVSGYRDSRKAEENSGVRTVEIVSSISPLKRVDPATDEGRAVVQRHVDTLAGVFVQHLARNRGTTEQTVLADYGKGDTLVGVRAFAEGLVDEISSFTNAIASMNREYGKSTLKRGVTMPKENAVADVESTMTAEAVREAFPEAADALAAQGKADGMKEGITAERARIAGISALSIAGYEATIESAINDGKTVEQAALVLLQEQQKRGKVQADQIAADALKLGQQSATIGAAELPSSSAQTEVNERVSAAKTMAQAANKQRNK